MKKQQSPPPPWPRPKDENYEDAVRNLCHFVVIRLEREITAALEAADRDPANHDPAALSELLEYRRADEVEYVDWAIAAAKNGHPGALFAIMSERPDSVRSRMDSETVRLVGDYATGKKEKKPGPGPKRPLERASHPIHLGRQLVPLARRVLEDLYPDQRPAGIYDMALEVTCKYLDDAIRVEQLRKQMERSRHDRHVV